MIDVWATILNLIPPELSDNPFGGCFLIAIYVSAENVDSYKTANGRNLFADIITAIVNPLN